MGNEKIACNGAKSSNDAEYPKDPSPIEICADNAALNIVSRNSSKSTRATYKYIPKDTPKWLSSPETSKCNILSPPRRESQSQDTQSRWGHGCGSQALKTSKEVEANLIRDKRGNNGENGSCD